MSFVDWITGRQEPKPPTFSGFSEQDSYRPDEPFKLSSPIDAEKGIEGLVVAIRYQDASGFNSSRRVRCSVVWSEGRVLYFRGWCFLRREDRTFRVDRIQELLRPPGTTVETDPTAYFDHFLAKDPRERAVREFHQRQGAWREVRDGLLVLAYLVNVDGEELPREWSEVERYVPHRLEALKLTFDDKIVALIMNDARGLFPTMRQVSGAARRIEEEPGHLEMLAPFIETVIRADDRIDDREIEGLRAVRKRVEKVRKEK